MPECFDNHECYDFITVRINKSKTFWVWFTAIAMLMAALMPSISHANREQTGASTLSPICTSTGMKWFDSVSGEVRDQSAQSQQGSTDEHCSWCSVHPVVLLSHVANPPPLYLELARLSPPVIQTAPKAFCWPPSLSRAPPLVA